MIRFLIGLPIDIIGFLINFIARRTFWRINKKDETYLQNYYNSIAQIDGNTEFAKKQTKLERQIIVQKREVRFWNNVSNFFS